MSYVSDIVATIKSGVDLAKRLGVLDAAEAIPQVASVIAAAKVVEAIASVVNNVQTRIDEGELVATSRDQEQIKVLANELSSINDDLAERIAAS